MPKMLVKLTPNGSMDSGSVFGTFIQVKLTKLPISQHPLKLEKNKDRKRIIRDFEFLVVYLY